MKRNVLILFAVVVACVVALFFGPDTLILIRLPGTLPLGTLFAIVALGAGAAIPLTVSRPATALRWIGVVAFIAALLWFPIGLYLAGNVRLNFTNDPASSVLFRQITIGTAALVLGTMIWAAAALVMRGGDR